MIEIKALHSSMYDCMDDCIYSICESFNINPIHTFSQSWNFIYWPKTGKLADSIIDQRKERAKLLEKYHGITLHMSFEMSIEEIKDHIEHKTPVIMEVDLFSLPWSDYYEKIHTSHCIIIVGYNQATDEYDIVDPTIQRAGIIAKTSAIGTIGMYMTLEMKNVSEENHNYIQLISDSTAAFHKYTLNGNAFADMEEYGDSLVDLIQSQDILKNYSSNPLDAEIFRHIQFTSRCRFCYASWIKYIGEQSKIIALVQTGENIHQSGLVWEKLRMKLMHLLCSNKLIKSKEVIQNYIHDLIYSEREIYSRLEAFCTGNDILLNGQKEDNFTYLNMVSEEVNLIPYYNNQAFYSERFENQKGGFDQNDYYYIRGEEQWQDESLLFDNVTGNGQTIIVNINYYQGIRLYASSSLGHCMEEIQVLFEDGTNEVIPIAFSYWCEAIPFCGEDIAWRGDCARLRNHIVEKRNKVNIFTKSYKLQNQKKVVGIKLPVNEYLHIFKIETIGQKNAHSTLYSPLAKSKLPEHEQSYWDKWSIKLSDYLIQEKHKIIYTNGNASNKVAITFDDAPDYYITSQIIDILKRYHVKATFSVIGAHIENNEHLIKQIYEDGHDIMNHTWNHTYLSQQCEETIWDELERTEIRIANIIGKTPALVRTPHGDFDDRVLAILKKRFKKLILWSYNTFDWVATCKEDIINDMAGKIRGGDIIVMHSYENKEATVESLSILIESLIDRGFELVGIGELLGIMVYVSNSKL